MKRAGSKKSSRKNAAVSKKVAANNSFPSVRITEFIAGFVIIIFATSVLDLKPFVFFRMSDGLRASFPFWLPYMLIVLGFIVVLFSLRKKLKKLFNFK